MRNGNKKRTHSQITLIILGICIILISSIETHALYNDSAQNQEKIFEVNAATLLISHEPIRIDGNNDLEAFCAGNGTDGLSWGTAFKIENYSITSGEHSGIFIQNTDKFLIINNCSIKNFDEEKVTDNGTYYEKGIEIQNCSNVKITNCSLIDNIYGIYLNSSTNNTIIQNNCSLNDYGYTLVNSENNTLFNNTASNNEGDGFRLVGSIHNNISTNIANFNNWNGITLDQYYSDISAVSSQENLIVNNIIENNQENGISFSYSDSNSVLNNCISNNRGSGITLRFSSDNYLSFNLINNNNNAGIELFDDCNWNLILNNNISDNSNGIYIINSGQNTIGENIITNHTSGYGILILYEDEYQSEQNIYGNIFENNSQDISYEQITYYSYSPPPYYVYVIIAVFIIGIVVILMINRKKIKKRWKKLISDREIRKSEQKIERAKKNKESSLKLSKISVENIDREDSKLSLLRIYKIFKVIGWLCVLSIMFLFIGFTFGTGAPYFLIDIPILIILWIINRKKISYQWNKFIAERENELRINRDERTNKHDSKTSKILIKNMNRKKSKSGKQFIFKLLKVLSWLFVLFWMFLFIVFSFVTGDQYFLIDIPIVIIIWFFYRKKTKFNYHKRKTNHLIKISKSKTKKAIDYAKMHKYKRSRNYWLSSERNYRRALRLVPDFHKIDFLEKKIISIKQNILATYISEGILLSKIAWAKFQENHFSQAKKQYSKSISAIELVLKSIETENVFSEEEEFPITASLIFEILQFLEKNLDQIKIKENNKKKSKVFIKSSDVQKINEKIVKSIKEMNESLWIYCQSLDSHEDLLDLDVLSKILESKLTKSEKILNSVQEQMQYLLNYMQTSTNRYERNGVETKSIAMNINRTLEQERIENKHLKIIREYEYIGGKIRLKVGMVNHSDNVLTNLALRFDLPESLKWIIHEPNLKRRGDTIHIAKLGGNEKIAISLYLEPINCLESTINATLTYFDNKDRPQAIIMAPKKVSISCPIFFTREEANLARVKKIQLELKYEDHKIFPLVKSNKSELIFNKILASIGKHDVKLVSKEYSLDNNKGEAYFYGITKVKKEKMIIYLLLDSNHQIIEISVNGDDQEPITGLLAELESEIRDKLLVHNIIEDSDKFHDINTSILLGNCPFCNGPISQTSISLFKKGETITCKYCDTIITPY